MITFCLYMQFLLFIRVQMCAQMQEMTPLHHACARGHDTIVSALLLLGANANAEGHAVSVQLAWTFADVKQQMQISGNHLWPCVAICCTYL